MPSLNFGDAPVWLQWVIAVAAVIAFVAGAIKLIPPAWRAVSRFVTTINSLADLPVELANQKHFRTEVRESLASQDLVLAKQDQKISDIHHEVQFNNGSSVKDGVTRVEEGVAGLYEVTTKLHEEIDELKKGKTDE